MDAPGEITRLLQAAQQGDESAIQRVIDSTYQELRRLAHFYMLTERRDHTLQPTAVLHEACLRLLGRDVHEWTNREHFFASVAQQMRRVLLDHARARHAKKRGGELPAARRGGSPLDVADPTALSPIEMIALDQALDALAKADPRQSRIVELRYFTGLSTEEIADVMQVAERTVRRDWVHARATLASHLGRGGSEPDALAS